MQRARNCWGIAPLLFVLLFSKPAVCFETSDGKIQLHGFYRMELRALSDDFAQDRVYLSQWAQTLNLELEWSPAPEGFGPFDLVQAFARVAVRYECVYTGCGASNSHRIFGDRAGHAPARNWADGKTSGWSGDASGFPRERVHGGSTELLPITSSPLLKPLFDAGATNVEGTLEPLLDDLFAYKKWGTSRDHTSLQLGPWRPESRVHPNGVLQFQPNRTSPLPMRPLIGETSGAPLGARGLFAPSAELRRLYDRFDEFDQNFRQSELVWDHGASQQDTRELKELYVDLELFDSRLWLRIGKQNIVWGKTELFRTTDQFNPQDIALSSLPSLEDSRIALWSLRAVYSLYDVGPLQDVRMELAVNYDAFEPTDLGRCGEPYAVWLVCAKSGGLLGHGLLGVGLAGEQRPPDPWDSLRGVEVGARVEFRWDRFSFALTDFYGYQDAPVLHAFNFYERSVDPYTGRPLDSLGRPLTPENALDWSSGNRQYFDFACSISVGIAAELLPALTENCVLDVLNANEIIVPIPPLTPAEAFGAILAGQGPPDFGGEQIAEALLNGSLSPTATRLTPLNRDPQDGPGTGLFASIGTSLSEYLTDQQEALLGCGPFYATQCDVEGIDLFNAEASALLQAFPNMEPDPPVATRFVDGKLLILPGARGPGDRGYDPNVDGTPPPGFRSEMEALSLNFARLLAIIEIAGGNSPSCSLDEMIQCTLVRAAVSIAGVQRPELRAGGNGRYGRRDFQWLGGGEAFLYYPKSNVLGFSMDFAEDRTKSNWSFEFTWIDDATLASSTSRSLNQEGDVFNLTVSVDRPTFINFLNANRTFFINAQVFFRYLADHNRSYAVNGPLSVLATFAVATGYYQDRLIPSTTFVHDFSSGSGAFIGQVGYRFTQDFSASVGVAIFYGGPQKSPVARHQLALQNNGGSFTSRTNYQGLSPLAERDELFLTVRYTF
jgi:hypothetical protein